LPKPLANLVAESSHADVLASAGAYALNHFHSTSYSQIADYRPRSGARFAPGWNIRAALNRQNGSWELRIMAAEQRHFSSATPRRLLVTSPHVTGTPYDRKKPRGVSPDDLSEADRKKLQELPDPVTKICWDNYFAVSPALAEKMELKRVTVLFLKIFLVTELFSHTSKRIP